MRDFDDDARFEEDLRDDFFDDFFDDFLDDDFLDDDFFDGTLPPSRLASERPMAMACFRLVTFLPERPLFSVPCLRSCIAFSTLSCDFRPYLAMQPSLCTRRCCKVRARDERETPGNAGAGAASRASPDRRDQPLAQNHRSLSKKNWRAMTSARR